MYAYLRCTHTYVDPEGTDRSVQDILIDMAPLIVLPPGIVCRVDGIDMTGGMLIMLPPGIV